MANIHIPVNPYDSGVRLNSDPYVSLYMRQQQFQRAKENAFDASLVDMQKNVTPAGMRTQDVAPFTEKSKEWMQFGIQNKQAIQNPAIDNGKARNQFMGLHRDLLGATAASKAELDKFKQLQSIRNDPGKMSLVDESTLQRWSKANKSIFDKEFEPLDPNATGFNEKPLEVSDLTNYNKYLLSGVSTKQSYVGSKPDPSDPLRKIDIYKYDHAPETLNTIAGRASTSFETSGKIKKHFTDRFNSLMPKPNEFNPNEVDVSPEFKAYNDKFKSFTGKDITTPKDFAVADALITTDAHSIEEKPSVNRGAVMDKQFNNSLILKRTPGASSSGGDGSKKNHTTDFVLRYKDAAETGDVEKMKEVLEDLQVGFGGKYGLNSGDISVDPKTKVATISMRPINRITGLPIDDNTLIEKKVIDLKDPKAYQKLGFVVQLLTGSQKKLEDNALAGRYGNSQADKPEPKPDAKPTKAKKSAKAAGL